MLIKIRFLQYLERDTQTIFCPPAFVAQAHLVFKKIYFKFSSASQWAILLSDINVYQFFHKTFDVM